MFYPSQKNNLFLSTFFIWLSFQVINSGLSFSQERERNISGAGGITSLQEIVGSRKRRLIKGQVHVFLHIKVMENRLSQAAITQTKIVSVKLQLPKQIQ